MRCRYYYDKNIRCKQSATCSGFCNQHVPNTYDKPDVCPICRTSMHQVSVPLQCGHWFHRSCVERTCDYHCPLCKHSLDEIYNSTRFITFYSQREINNHTDNPSISYFNIAIVILLPVIRYYGCNLYDIICSIVSHDIPVSHPFHSILTSLIYADVVSHL